MFGMSGESVVKTRTTESPLGIRQDLVDRTGPMAAGSEPLLQHKGSYSLRLASGSFYFIDPEAHEYWSIGDPAGDFLKDTTQMLKAMESFSGKVDAKSNSEVDSVGKGDDILGQRTAHWRIHDQMRMSMKTGDDSILSGSDLTTEAYFANSIPRLAPTGMRDLKFGAEAKKKLPQTLALRALTKGTMSMPGMTMPMQISMEVTQVEKRQIDPALFEVPPGYKKVEMPLLTSPQRNF